MLLVWPGQCPQGLYRTLPGGALGELPVSCLVVPHGTLQVHAPGLTSAFSVQSFLEMSEEAVEYVCPGPLVASATLPAHVVVAIDATTDEDALQARLVLLLSALLLLLLVLLFSLCNQACHAFP